MVLYPCFFHCKCWKTCQCCVVLWCFVSLGREECFNVQITSLHRIHHIRYLTTSAESFRFHAYAHVRTHGIPTTYCKDCHGSAWYYHRQAMYALWAFCRQIVYNGNVSIDAEIAVKTATPLEKFWISSRVFCHNHKVEIWESISNKHLLCFEITWSSVASCRLPGCRVAGFG